MTPYIFFKNESIYYLESQIDAKWVKSEENYTYSKIKEENWVWFTIRLNKNNIVFVPKTQKKFKLNIDLSFKYE